MRRAPGFFCRYPDLPLLYADRAYPDSTAFPEPLLCGKRFYCRGSWFVAYQTGGNALPRQLVRMIVLFAHSGAEIRWTPADRHAYVLRPL